MSQGTRLFDDLAKLMTDAAGMAQGVRREAETVMRGQFERLLRDMDVVSREEFEAVREMASLAREENDRLIARIAALEAKLGGMSGMGAGASQASAATGATAPAATIGGEPGAARPSAMDPSPAI
jgi:BMFP domain-containing protein YqiC